MRFRTDILPFTFNAIHRSYPDLTSTEQENEGETFHIFTHQEHARATRHTVYPKLIEGPIKGALSHELASKYSMILDTR